MERIKKYLKSHKKECILITLMCLYFFLFSFLSIAQFDGLKTQMNDLGNMDQPIYNTTKGRFMMTSNCAVCENPIMSRFGGHANFIFLFFVPIYFLFPDPKILLLTQTILITLGALPLYWFGKRLFGNDSWLSLTGPIIYLINPMVHDVNLYDFHAVSLAMPLILFVFYFLYTRNFLPFYIFSVLIALSKEDMPLIVLMMGLYLVFAMKERWRGLAVSLSSLLYFILLVEIVIPFFADGQGLMIISQRYAYLGDDVSEIVKNLFLQPDLFISHLITPERLTYVLFLIAPVVFLPLLSLEIFGLSLPSFLINLLSENPMMYFPFQFYHMAPILPFIFLATIKSLYKFRVTRPKLFSVLVVPAHLIGIAVLASMFFSPAPYSFVSTWKEFDVTKHAAKISEIKKLIPDDASLSVQNNLGAKLSHRQYIYTFPYNSETTDYVLLDVNDPFPIVRNFPRQKSFTFITQMHSDDYNRYVLNLFENEDYGVIFSPDDGYLLFKKYADREKNENAREIFETNMDKILRKYKI